MRRLRRLGTAAFVALLGSTALTATQPVRPADDVLPDYDSRDTAAAPAPRLETAVAIGRLDRDLQARVRLHPRTGVVRLLTPRTGTLTPARSDGADTIALEFVQAHAAAFGLDANDVKALAARRAYASVNDTGTHVTLAQEFDGIPVFDGVLAVHVDRLGRIFRVASHASSGRGRVRQVAMSADEAVRAAAFQIRPGLTFTPALREAPSGPERLTVFEPGPFASPVMARLVYFPSGDRLVAAWLVYVEPGGFPQAYDVIVDGRTGELLYRRNRHHYINGVGRVLQSPARAALDPRRPDEHPGGSGPSAGGDPPNGCPPVADYVLRDLTSPFRDAAQVLADDGRLEGNNVRVFRGAPGTSAAEGTGAGGAWQFDFPFNSRESAETFLFFASNFVHDFYYDLGFDEAAGNFQADNFGRGGTGGDPLHAVARAQGRNNATFAIGPEGESPIMSMFLWDGRGCWAQDVNGDGTSDLDGGYDLDIIVHEYHHGLTHRVNPVFTGNEAGAIGEGGGDFFAYSLNGDARLAEYSSPPFGIRGVNAKTYADWFCFFGLFCSVHGNGEIWANTLWDLRERFRLDQVGGTEGSGIVELHRLYVDGLKLSPPQPTMLDLRDAMVQADALRNPSGAPGGSESFCRLWEGFARRGMGVQARDTADTGTFSVVADFSRPAECPEPPPLPLVTVHADVPTTTEGSGAGGQFVIGRTGDVTAELIVSYTVSGTAFAGLDYPPLPPTAVIPAGEASVHVPVDPVDDALVEPDETVVLAVSPGGLYDVGEPSSASVTIVSDDVRADLVMASLSAPGEAGAGQAVLVTDTVRNQGQAASGAFTVRYYLSGNPFLDASDRLLDGARTVADLAPGAEHAAQTNVTLPADAPAGTSYVIALADADAVVEEISESNNTRYTLVRIGPDLAVSGMSAPAAAVAGATITVDDVVRNQGAGAAGASATRFYLSTNTILDSSDQLLSGGRSVPALMPAASSAGSSAVTVPAMLAGGTYYLLAVADGDGAVAETSETNNTRAAILRVGPDLQVTAVSAPLTAGAGAAITVGDTVSNEGSAASAASTTRWYLSANSIWDTGDLPLAGGRAVPALAPGASHAGSLATTIPEGTPVGSYYLIARADADEVVPESLESNNTRAASLQVGTDLIVSALAAPPAAAAGGSIAVTDTTANQGQGSAGASTTRFYLSANPVLDAGDVALGDGRAVPALAAGASSTGTTTVSLPLDTPAGRYSLIALADAGGAVVETLENNNTRAVPVSIGPDLVVSSLTAPTKGGAGASLVVAETLANEGAGAAAASTTRYYFSPNAFLDPDDVPIGSRAAGPLPAGGSAAGSATLVLPAGTPTGNWYVFAVADADGAVPEALETNNTRSRIVQVGPDLVVSALSAPSSAAGGQTILVTDTTKNQGGGGADAAVTRFHLSANSVLDASDLLLDGGRVTAPLAGDGSTSGACEVALPAGLAPGTYYLIGKADAGGTVAETSETNNTRVRLLQITN